MNPGVVGFGPCRGRHSIRFFTEPYFSFCPTDFRFSSIARQLDGNSSLSCFNRLPEEVNQFRHVMIEGEEVALLPNAVADGLQVLPVSQLDGELVHRFKKYSDAKLPGQCLGSNERAVICLLQHGQTGYRQGA